MTYFAFLGWCLGIPLVLLTLLAWRDGKQGRKLPVALRSWPLGVVMAAHVVVALLYTTPWDNYLVATQVWWYEPRLVSGIVLGWVPVEEYTFFVLQTILTTLWFSWLARRALVTQTAQRAAYRLRVSGAGGVTLLWLIAIIILAAGWAPGTYLGLELAWALPPIIFQLAFGADILWRYRRLIFWSIAVPTLYLAIGDRIAIQAGTWTIDPLQSTGVLLLGLPIEEFIFFLLTNTLVVLGTVLVLARASQERVPQALRDAIRRWDWRALLPPTPTTPS
ncbi:MAG: lycopene cyclase domain-containing protein [Caldilineaceae bacterium]